MPYRRTWQSSPFVSPPILIILLPIIALTILFFAIPPLLSATTHVLRPNSVVKKSWDSLNILLVVFAILCGVFARRNDDESQHQHDAVLDRNAAFRKVTSEEEEEEEEGEGRGTGGYVPQQWFGFSEERRSYDSTPIRVQSPATGATRLRRSSSSYPDLRSWETGDERFRFRFFDDYEIDKQFRSPVKDQITTTVDLRTRWPETEEAEVVQVKEIPVDTYETRSSSPPPEPPPESQPAPTPPPPPPPPPPPVESRRKPRRTYQKVESVSEITELEEDREFTNIRSPPPTAPLTPPPPPPQATVKPQSEHKHKRSERRKSSMKRDIATVWASVLSNQKKKKKKQRPRTENNHNYDNIIDELTNSNTIPPPSPAPPPPPPPPPPPSVFHSLFRKGLGKSKKIHSVSAPPAPPPPPPLTSSRRWSKWKSPIPPPPPPPPPPAADPPQPLRRRSAGRPPLPNKASSYYDEAVINTGNQSPMIPVPPPPPPFKMPAMKFVVRGDFVRIRSNQSSRCSSPERDEIDTSSSTIEELETAATVNAVTDAVTDRNGDTAGSVFCPSPDVNVKAATFIARLRGEWKLEKLNSLKEKGNGALPLKGNYHM